jgi:ribosomal protein S18 acetylase RimI-like enzyme
LNGSFGVSEPERRLFQPDAPPFRLQTDSQRERALAALGVKDLFEIGFDAELAVLPGEYAAPNGALLLATVDGALAGCGAFRPLHDVDYPNACEMKRLYVRRAFRRFGLGRLLARQLMDCAIQAGYSTMLLDTLDDMEAARNLYETLGFEEIPPYYFNPVPGAHYLKVDLRQSGLL